MHRSWRDIKADHYYTKAFKRLSVIGEVEIIDWIRVTEMSVAQHLDLYAQTRESALLNDARIGIVALLAAADVLQDRERA